MKTDGLDFEALAREHRTPFYLYDMDQALEHLGRLRRHLPDRVDVLYAIKANPNRRVAEAFEPHVWGLDISSIGELGLAVEAGYSPARMSFAGPGKRDDELRRSIEAGLHVLSVESHAELERLIAIATELGRPMRVTVRVNPASVPNAFMMKMGGRPSQFGIAEEDVAATLELARRAPLIELQGVHVFSGTQCLDQQSVIDNVQSTLELAARLAEAHDLHPKITNLGGGFGVPYFPGQEAMDVDALSLALGQTIGGFVAQQPRFASSRFIFELGRYLIGFFGVYVARVLDVKQTRGKRFAIMDGGMNHCFAATGNFGQLVKKNYPVRNLSNAAAPTEKHELVGPLCTPLDSMARSIEMPRVEVGDLVCFDNSGAYGYSASPLLFLAHETPVELVKHDGRIAVARPRLSPSHFA